MPRWKVHFEAELDLSGPNMVALIERGRALASVIRDIPIPPYLQLRLDALNIFRAVRGTTAIEGSQISTQEVREIMASPGKTTLPAARRRDEQEVRNAQEVMFYVANLLDARPDHPITEELICKLHELTTKGIRYRRNTPGQYRSHSVNAGDYLPPETGDEVRRLMTEFVEWFRSPPARNWEPIIRALVAHFYVVSIHPFGDGNGRTARAVESFLLYQGKINARGFYSLANYYYQNKTDYIWHLDNARFQTDGNLTEFVLFALRGLIDELQTIHTEVINEVKLISYRDYAREMFQHEGRLGTKTGERIFHFLMALGREPASIAELTTLTRRRRVSLRTMQRDLAFLRDRELIKIQDGEVIPNLEVMERFTAIKELQTVQGLLDGHSNARERKTK